MLARTLTLIAAVLLLFGFTPPAGAQLLAPTARVEVAEIRGLDVVPGDIAKGFDAATPSSAFASAVKTVFVRFQASKPPAAAELFISWSVTSDSGDRVELKRTPVEAAGLESGVIDALGNEGKPLAAGAYSVTLVGADAKIYRRTEFRVGPRPPVARTASTVPLEKVYFDQYSLAYPTTFTPQPVVVGMTGVFLRRTAPFGLMFAVLSEPNSDTIVPQGRAIVDIMVRRIQSGAPRITKTFATDIPPARLGPDMVAAKILDFTMTHGLSARVGLYSKNVEGRRVLFGYAWITGEKIPEEYVPLLTTDPDALEADFFQMLASFKGGTPWGAKTPGERP